MVLFCSFSFSILFLSSLVIASPIEKRIAQIITDSTTQWVQACTAAGGAGKCQPVSQTAFMSLLAAGKNCDQQNAADAMVDLAKQLNNNSEMIRLSKIFVQQPRNAPDSLQVPYCQTAPKNQELVGLFHCQFAGSDFTKFSGDQTGNVPLGLSAVNPPGSCPAKTDGPVPDGVQLNTLVSNPGVPLGSGSTGTNSTGTMVTGLSVKASTGNNTFTLQNGKDAQALNKQFTTLNANSPCTVGTSSCVNGDFAQCTGATFALSPCGGGTQCFALPLVNKAGTSITCTTQADAVTRIAATGATGGITGA